VVERKTSNLEVLGSNPSGSKLPNVLDEIFIQKEGFCFSIKEIKPGFIKAGW
jgi:hypothetical protein